MAIDRMCSVSHCPLSDNCLRKQTAPQVGQIYSDYGLECLGTKLFSRLQLQNDVAIKPMDFASIWQVVTSKIGPHYAYYRPAWNETYNARSVELWVYPMYNGKIKYDMRISPLQGQPGGYLNEDYYPSLEDLTAIDWMIRRR